MIRKDQRNEGVGSFCMRFLPIQPEESETLETPSDADLQIS